MLQWYNLAGVTVWSVTSALPGPVLAHLNLEGPSAAHTQCHTLNGILISSYSWSASGSTELDLNLDLEEGLFAFAGKFALWIWNNVYCWNRWWKYSEQKQWGCWAGKLLQPFTVFRNEISVPALSFTIVELRYPKVFTKLLDSLQTWHPIISSSESTRGLFPSRISWFVQQWFNQTVPLNWDKRPLEESHHCTAVQKKVSKYKCVIMVCFLRLRRG